MPTEYFLAHIWLIPLFPAGGRGADAFHRPPAAERGRQRHLRGQRVPVDVLRVRRHLAIDCAARSRSAWSSYNLFDWVPAGRDAHQRRALDEFQRAVGHAARPADRA